jgi:amino acid adenylation domain-containing protein
VSTTLVHDLLRASAERFPSRTAVVDGGRSVAYADLEATANRLAHLLAARSVRHGDRVGLYLDKSLEALVGIYGILKAGATYVPLDPGAPPPRLGSIASDAGLRLLITSKAKADLWALLIAEGAPVETLVILDADDGEVTPPDGLDVVTASALEEHPSDGPPDVPCASSDLAYILYTSGSTGVPKGVMLSHLNAMSFVDWATEEFGIAEDDRLSSHAPLHFDLSVFDLFAAAKAGAAVVLVPQQLALFPVELAKWIHETGITVWYSVPSILTLLVLRGRLHEADLRSLRTVLFAGEVFPSKYLHPLMQILSCARFANLFGPTETNVCTWYEVPRARAPTESIPIGRAITGVETFAVGEDGSVLPQGEVGELYVRGPTVMQGYWGDEERTQAALLRDWQGESGGFPVYRTGDLVCLDDSGNWIFLGRRDSQIKSRGYRIELGDIEAALSQHPSVLECAIVPVPDEVVTNRIKAFVVVSESVEDGELSRFCGGRLPRYMTPEFYEFLDELPRSSTGKIDRRSLAAGTQTTTAAAVPTADRERPTRPRA